MKKLLWTIIISISLFQVWAQIDTTPPSIELALASVGGRKIYLRFSEPVYGGTIMDELAPNIFALDGIEVPEYEEISFERSSIGGVKGMIEIYVTTRQRITADQIINSRIIAQGNIIDIDGNVYLNQPRAISDVLIGFIEPVWAINSIQVSSASATSNSSLRNFEGQESLLDLDITIEASQIMPDGLVLSQPSLFFDLDVPDSNKLDMGFWSPVSPFPTGANSEARMVSPVQISSQSTTALYQHKIPATDTEISAGKLLEFTYLINNIPAGWTNDVNLPNNVKPWSIRIGDFIQQSKGITIRNNVINPNQGDRATIHIDVERSGLVIANVFTLDGKRVKELHRELAGVGNLVLHWDGTNSSGNKVAPGFYTIRSVGPNFDETRKVLVLQP